MWTSVTLDALNVAITMSLKLFKKIGISSSLEDLIDDDSIMTFELSLLASNIRRKVCGVLDSFISFLKKYLKKHITYLLC